ncbi:MAG: TAXI family TRAP transporter solute-binding subunit, partial [Rhodospirillaceae bacterium]
FVNDSSDIRTFADLKGRRVPAGWTSQRLGEYLFRGFFANVGMSYDDVEKVTLAAMPRMWEEFVQGNVDVAFGTFGGSQVQEIKTRVNGIRYLQLNSDPEAVKVMEAILPSAYVTRKPTKSGEMVNVMEFDFVVFTGAHVADDVVYKTVSAIHGGKADLVATSGLWNALNPSGMAKKVKVPFHPGAEKFYREQGILPAQH